MPFRIEHIKGVLNPADALSRLVQTIDLSRLKPRFDDSKENIIKLQSEDDEISALRFWLIEGKFQDINPFSNKFVTRLRNKAILVDDLVMIQSKSGLEILTPLKARNKLLYMAHDDVLSGHRASDSTFNKLNVTWYWPNMEAEVKKYCKSCQICQESNLPHRHTKVPLQSPVRTNSFNDRVHMDLLGPLISMGENKYLLVLIDSFSRWTELCPIVDKSAKTVANAIMENWFLKFTAPKHITSDQGEEFVNYAVSNLNEFFNVKHILCSVAHPESNGLVERCNRKIIDYLRKYTSRNEWESLVPFIQFSLNTIVHSSSKISAFEVLFGRKPSLPGDLLKDELSRKYYGEENLKLLLNNFRNIHTSRYS